MAGMRTPLWRVVCSFFLLVIAVGCASGRLGVIQVRLPAETRSGYVDIKLVDAEIPRAMAHIQTILREHGLKPIDPSKSGEDSGVMVALQGYVQPQTLKGVDLDARHAFTWVRVIEKPDGIPDKISCRVTPPASGNVLQVLLTLEYSSRVSTPLARSLYDDLARQLIARYGADRVQVSRF
jgi:hypothetical protein